MANYEFTVISNYFKVKNPNEFLEIVQKLGYEESYYDENNNKICIASYEQCWSTEHIILIDKNINKCIGAIQECDYYCFDLEEYLQDINLECDTEDIVEVCLDKYIQSQLLENEYFAIKETGNEKLRYNVGYAEVITKNNIKWFSLDCLIEEYIQKELDK